MTTHGAVRRLNAAVVGAGGVARFFSDNGFIGGLAQDVWPAIEHSARAPRGASEPRARAAAHVCVGVGGV